MRERKTENEGVCLQSTVSMGGDLQTKENEKELLNVDGKKC